MLKIFYLNILGFPFQLVCNTQEKKLELDFWGRQVLVGKLVFRRQHLAFFRCVFWGLRKMRLGRRMMMTADYMKMRVDYMMALPEVPGAEVHTNCETQEANSLAFLLAWPLCTT